MNNHRKIGFRAYNDNAQNSEEDEQKKKQAERQKAIADFIGHNYSPIGATSQKCYKTTVELVYELSNIVDVAPMELAKQLTDARYHVEYLAGQPYWVCMRSHKHINRTFFLFLKSLLVRVGAFFKIYHRNSLSGYSLPEYRAVYICPS